MRVITIAAAAALASACASPAPVYQSRADGGRYGYAEMQLEPNRVRISYNGATMTARETVETYLLYRAAETTLARGFDYFIVVAHDAQVDRQIRGTAGARPLLTGATFHEVSLHTAMADILMFEGERPSHIVNTYDAHAIQQSLHERVIQRPAAY